MADDRHVAARWLARLQLVSFRPCCSTRCGMHAPRVIILDLALLISLDTTGVEALDTLRTQIAQRGGTLILAAPHEQPMSMLARSGFIGRVGADNVVADLPAARARAGALAASA